ncbi:MAG: ABC transporter ATP-binding protein [Sphaerochaetaceae bacterium]
MQEENILEIKDLTVQYITEEETVEAVNELSLSVARGRTIGLVGETGAGKTTTAKAIMRLIPDPPGKIISGTVMIDGKDVYALKPAELEHLRGNEVAMIFQNPMSVLNPVFTIGDQIAECYEIHEGLSRQEAREKANHMLKTVGISLERVRDYPHQFSGGMKQRVVIAIALACNPKLIIADEPTTALDVTIQAQVLALIKDLITKNNASMIIITHDLGIVSEVCDEIAVMYAGRIIEKGTLAEVFRETRHPYTEGLFNSLPNIYEEKDMLKPIPGLMPDPTDLPPGCAFAPRCEYACEKCLVKRPELVSFGGNHECACIRYEEKDFIIDRSRRNKE